MVQVESCAIPRSSDPNIPDRFFADAIQPGKNTRLVSVLCKCDWFVSEDGLSFLIRKDSPTLAFDFIHVSTGFNQDLISLIGLIKDIRAAALCVRVGLS